MGQKDRHLGQVVVALSACLVAVAGCGSSSGGGGTGGTGGAGGGGGVSGTGGAGGACAQLWNVGRIGTTATQSASVEAGALVLRSSNSSQNNLLNVSQRFALAGDFTATFEFEGFVSGGDGAFVQAAVVENVAQPTAGIATAGIGKVPQTNTLAPGISATFQPGSSDLKAATGTAGTFRFERTGSSVTVTTRLTDGTTATVTNPTYGTFNLQVGLQIGSNLTGVITAESSIRISAFTVTGGGGSATSDDFACNSLLP